MKRAIVLSAIVIITTFGAFAGKDHEVRKYDGKASRNGAVVYALPKVNIYVEVSAECCVNLPGPFAQYAERYLATKDAIMHRSKVWSFDKVKISDELAIDSAKLYTITNEKEKLTFKKGKPFLASVGDWCETSKEKPHKPFKNRKRVEQIDTLFHTELLGEEALSSTSVPKMAERAAKQITQLREARMAILTCDVAHQPDGIATREILHKIDSVERELTALFVGKRVTITAKRRFAIDPTKRQNNIIIARLSTIEGIKEADEMIGIPIYVDVNPEILNAPEVSKKEKKAKKGYFYNVPGSVTINVRQGNEYTLTESIVAPQNGYTAWLKRDVRHIIFTKIGEIQMIK